VASLYKIAERARQDIKEIEVYLAQRNPDAAFRFLERFEVIFDNLAMMPLMGRGRPEVARDVRSFAEPPYTIFYRPEKDGIMIVRVLHGARDIEALFADILFWD
jgi:toxin ParE1/3/4